MRRWRRLPSARPRGTGLATDPAGPPEHRIVVDPAAVRAAQTSPPPSRRLRRRSRLDVGLAAGPARRHLAGPVAGQRRGRRRTALAAYPGGVAGWPRPWPVMDARLVLPGVIHRLRRRPHPTLAELACCSAIPAGQPDQHHGAAAATPKGSHRCKHCVRPSRTCRQPRPPAPPTEPR